MMPVGLGSVGQGAFPLSGNMMAVPDNNDPKKNNGPSGMPLAMPNTDMVGQPTIPPTGFLGAQGMNVDPSPVVGTGMGIVALRGGSPVGGSV